MKSHTQTPSAPASRLTIATRLGSPSAWNRAASVCATRPSSGGEPGQQHGDRRSCSFLFIDVHRDCVLHAGYTPAVWMWIRRNAKQGWIVGAVVFIYGLPGTFD